MFAEQRLAPKWGFLCLRVPLLGPFVGLLLGSFLWQKYTNNVDNSGFGNLWVHFWDHFLLKYTQNCTNNGPKMVP